MFGLTHRSVTIRFVLSALTVAISSVGLGQLATAQNYKSIEPKLEFREARQTACEDDRRSAGSIRLHRRWLCSD